MLFFSEGLLSAVLAHWAVKNQCKNVVTHEDRGITINVKILQKLRRIQENATNKIRFEIDFFGLLGYG